MRSATDPQAPAGGWLKAVLLAVSVAVAMLASPPAARAQDGYLMVGVGAFAVFDDDDTTFQGELQWRPGLKWWIIQPMLGVMATGDGAVYGYVGLSADVALGSSIVVRPSFAVGAFDEGSGRDLGHTVEFRSGIEIAYQFADRSRLGVELSHLSNAGLDDDNPGAETILLTYAIPTSRLFGR